MKADKGPAQPSRRSVMAGMSTTALPASGAASAAAVAGAWLALDREAKMLGRAWGRLEAAGGAGLARLDARVEAVLAARDGLTARLAPLNAGGPAGLAAKLAVLAELVAPEDHPDAHALILSLARDVAG